jgi:hypothetical protein
MYPRGLFGIPNMTGVIGGDDSTLGNGTSEQRYKNKREAALHYEKHYGHSFVNLKLKDDGNVKFDFVYDIEVDTEVEIETGNYILNETVVKFLEKLDKDTVLYLYNNYDDDEPINVNCDPQEYINTLQQQIFKKWI